MHVASERARGRRREGGGVAQGFSFYAREEKRSAEEMEVSAHLSPIAHRVVAFILLYHLLFIPTMVFCSFATALLNSFARTRSTAAVECYLYSTAQRCPVTFAQKIKFNGS